MARWHRSDPKRRHRRACGVFAAVAAHIIISALVTAGAIGPSGSLPMLGGPVTVLSDVVDRPTPAPPSVDLQAISRARAAAEAPARTEIPPAEVAAVPPTAAALGPDGGLGPAAADMVGRINELRASVGVAPLTVDRELTERALGWAQAMARGGDIGHQTDLSVGLSADWLRLGENVGYGPDVGPIHDGFVLSPTHYANLVDPGFTSIGVGVVEIRGRLYVAQEFMERTS